METKKLSDVNAVAQISDNDFITCIMSNGEVAKIKKSDLLPLVSSAVNGLMSSSDKIKLTKMNASYSKDEASFVCVSGDYIRLCKILYTQANGQSVKCEISLSGLRFACSGTVSVSGLGSYWDLSNTCISDGREAGKTTHTLVVAETNGERFLYLKHESTIDRWYGIRASISYMSGFSEAGIITVKESEIGTILASSPVFVRQNI